jgi:hypothetical protein
MRITTVVLGMLGAGLCVLFAYAGDNNADRPSTAMTSIGQMFDLNADQRNDLLNKLEKDRMDTQRLLLDKLAVVRTKEDKFAAAYLLGMYRMEGAVPKLSEFISLEAEETLNDAIPRWHMYPIVDALIAIGNPAVPKMVENIENSGDPKVRELSGVVISYVEGPKVGGFVLQLALQKQVDAGKKARLQTVVDYMAAEVVRRGQ